MDQENFAFWAVPHEELLQRLNASPKGLTEAEAQNRRKEYISRRLRPRKETTSLILFLNQFKSPIILLLIFAAVLSIYLRQAVEASLILIIIFVSGLLGFWQERRAADAVAELLAVVQIRAAVLRDGKEIEIPLEDVVPGDIVVLNAGDIIPGDARILESRDLFVNEAALTGETYPADKIAGMLPQDTPLARRKNSLFMGTNVVSGTANALIVAIGKDTEFGRVSERLEQKAPETEFEHGVRRFGYLLLEVTLMLVVAIFAINVYLDRPIIEAFLFSLTLAVGLTPQLLPAIISINLAQGARRMASHKVIVKRLASIENFGSMNVLCCDKTGTLTEGNVKMRSALDVEGRESKEIAFFAYLNAYYETGFANPIDEAILSYSPQEISGFKKLDEVPYDFIRKRLSILVSHQKDDAQKDDEKEHIIITKGALANVLEVSSYAKTPQGVLNISLVRDEIDHRFHDLSAEGFRVLGLAIRVLEAKVCLGKDEADMTFLGFLVFYDPPKENIAETINNLAGLGVTLKVITGDNRLVAASIGKEVGLKGDKVFAGSELNKTSDEALLRQVQEMNIFAEVEPNQKERLILALRKVGNVVGYMGDGINDASALHAADIGISVDSAVDVAKEAADIVLLEKDLSVLSQGVVEGRKTFSNTMKYVFMATSANFGNMFSMALLSIFLPFLPMLPVQVLLTNLLTDLPEMTIAGDSVDPELIARPRRWSIKFIRNFMVVFGILRSIFDFLTFGVLLFLLHAGVNQFRTGWFIESVVSASMVVLVIRTRRPFFKSMPSKYLLTATLAVVVATFLLPYTPLAKLFVFTPLPLYFLIIVAVIVAIYILAAELVKRLFYSRVRY
jgi:P-type Mg2+ transporter